MLKEVNENMNKEVKNQENNVWKKWEYNKETNYEKEPNKFWGWKLQ